MISIREFLGLNYYTSELDQFLIDFDQSHSKLSASQRAEKEKYARIFELRDNPHQRDAKEHFWDNF
jgi:hypothetical protein